MRKLACFLSALTLIVSSKLAFAGDYQVEMIIFSRLTSKGLISEQWPAVTDFKLNRSAIKLKHRGEYFKLLPSRLFVMNEEQKRLDKSGTFKTLLHIAWRQPAYSAEDARPIHIYGGGLYDDQGHLMDFSAHENIVYNPDQRWQINGTLMLSVNHYFNINYNLLFTQPTLGFSKKLSLETFKNINGNFAYFQLQQSRRTRSKELNYFDHPLYGILLKITPVS